MGAILLRTQKRKKMIEKVAVMIIYDALIHRVSDVNANENRHLVDSLGL